MNEEPEPAIEALTAGIILALIGTLTAVIQNQSMKSEIRRQNQRLENMADHVDELKGRISNVEYEQTKWN